MYLDIVLYGENKGKRISNIRQKIFFSFVTIIRSLPENSQKLTDIFCLNASQKLQFLTFLFFDK